MADNAMENKLNLKSAPINSAAVKKSSKKKSAFSANAEIFIKMYQPIVLIVFLVLIIVGAFLLVMFYGNDITALREENQRQEKILETKRQELDKLKAVKIDPEAMAATGQKILEILPQEKDLPDIFLQLEAMAEKNNLFMNMINVAEDAAMETEEGAPAKIKKLNLNMNLSGGDYFTLKSYLNDMEKNLRLMDVQSIVYSPESKTFNLSVNTYYLEP
ncbi:type 4a pilus biogenesis protein PilO [Patescibacteria group bacterium]|nr:type 4a pilus biogenesis protein PilO [Patescibacteria group bacterium]